MADTASIQGILKELQEHAEQSSDPVLQARVEQLDDAIAKIGGSISVGDISGSTAVAIGSDIQIILHQHQSNLPEELLTRLMTLTDHLNQRADASPRAGGHIRVFLASPGDVQDERKLALKAISKISADPYYKDLKIEAIAWDKPEDSTPMLAGLDPQRAIREGLAEPSECDICVVIFWSRMGTPLDHTLYKKADGSQYLSGTEWELENALVGFSRYGLPLAMVYRRTEKLLLDPDAPDFQEKARQWGLVRDFFDSAKNPDGSIKLSYNTYISPSEFGDLFELHLRKLIVQVVDKKRKIAQPQIKLLAEKIVPAVTWPKDKSPFPGLRAFGPADAPIFFGRGMEADLLLRRLSNPNCRFLTVVGASGSGKSSLVGAGLLPRLKEGALPGSEDWPVVTFTPDAWGDGNPFNALTSALSQPPFQFQAREIGARLREKTSALRELIDAYLAKGPEWKRVVFFIDQFEELFTRILDESLRREFSLLLSETANSPRILTVVTMRDDFYHYCVKSPVLSRLINRNTDSTFTLSAPGQLELYEMITGPARVVGLQFENGLVRRILDDTGSEPGALALMAYALDELHKASGGDGKMNFAQYNLFGGVQGVIGARAQETFDGLSTDAKKTLPRVFRELLEVDESGTATRKRALLSNVARDGASRELVQAFVEARLLVTSRSASDQPLAEVAHEALFRSWPALKAWVEESQDDLILLRQVRTAADWWNKHERRPEFLWPDERLQPVYAMRKRLAPVLNETEQEFIRLEVERLLEEIDDPVTNHRRRSWIGERLDTLGDPRPGVGLVRDILPLRAAEGSAFEFNSLRAGEIRLWGDKSEHKGLPDIVWCSVDGGSIKIEESSFMVQPFYIAKYPVTYKQFQSFMDAEDGFKDPRWWKRLSADQNHEIDSSKQKFKFNNHPRENVSWYGAIAFCCWLNARMNWNELPADLSSKTLEAFRGIRLPAEWEWQWAATGGNTKFEYPWGQEQHASANTLESGLGRTTAVGMYPAGSAKCGALDLTGNVEEWCLNGYIKRENVGLSGPDARVLRGGSWNFPQGFASASYRARREPDFRGNDYGFRLIVRPPSL